MHVFYLPEEIENTGYLSPDESRHCTKVLRLKQGDAIQVLDGLGAICDCIITNPDHRKCEFEVKEKHQHRPFDYHIHIAIAPTKNMDRLEWFVEKTVELGISEISLVECSRSERTSCKADRLMRKAVSAMKQSGNFILPEINELKPLYQFISSDIEGQKFIAYVSNEHTHHLIEKINEGQNVTVLIGPEGDFTIEEIDYAIQHGFVPISLGKSRLRTETAGIAACHMIHLANYK